MGATGLLERMQGGRRAASEESPVDAVLEHLKLLLNARRGSVAHLADYGLPDISEVFEALPESVETLRRAIETTIRRYEPRLTGAAVTLIEGADDREKVFRVTFRVTGTIVADDRRVPVQFNTTVTDTGRARVE
jgi:type VI secretion system protein